MRQGRDDPPSLGQRSEGVLVEAFVAHPARASGH